ncbi:hypothetical protein [Streptomyces sp. DG1A-41]|uniref:hypothetical protein n=1 Tax=Streptomyces sp. DG1A-41 TaxID=3125779 RepID=UPI0030D3BD2D
MVAVRAAVVTSTLALTRGGEPACSSAVGSDLPEGWKPWASAAKAPPGSERVLGGPGTSLTGRAAVDRSLVCAGAALMATRFGLADGRNTWSRSIDRTPHGRLRQ